MQLETNPLLDRARDISQRILNGEKLPLSELREFILSAHLSAKGDRKKQEAKDKDVNFF